MPVSIALPTLTCLRCGHQWHPRTDNLPKKCARCRSPYWNIPKRIPNANPTARRRRQNSG